MQSKTLSKICVKYDLIFEIAQTKHKELLHIPPESDQMNQCGM
jgi:hypothetical protein